MWWNISRYTTRARRFGPVTDRRRRHIAQPFGYVLAPARAADPVQVVLNHALGHQGHFVDLVRTGDPGRLSGVQVLTAHACPGRMMRTDLVQTLWVGDPGQARSRHALAFAPGPPLPFLRGAGLVRPGSPSLEGGIEEFPLSRERAFSRTAIRASCTAIR